MIVHKRLLLASLLFIGLGSMGCGNRNGAGGTSDGTSEESYELRSKDNLVPARDQAKEQAADTARAQAPMGATDTAR